jgi:hypothetical protein
LGWIWIVLLLPVIAAQAQLELGDNLKLNLGGSLGFGYGGTFGPSNSAHSTSISGSGGLSGFYYHPNFVSFSMQPYYNRSQSNSASQSIFNESGFSASSNFFSGSRFPGSVGFSKSFNSSGEFGIPGLGGVTTDGSAQGFNINWSALLPKLPTLHANFSTNSSSATVLGADGGVDTHSRSFGLNSAYTIAGFHLGGYYSHQNMGLNFPAFLATEGSEGTTSSYGVTADHSLPLSGSFSASWSRSNYGGGDGIRVSGSTDTTAAVASVSPFPKLTVVSDVRYTANLLGALQRTVIIDGVLSRLPQDSTSRSISFGTSASYRLFGGLGVSGSISHREQFYLGQHVSDTRYGGLVTYNYARPLLGMIYVSFGLVDRATERGNNGLGFSGSVSLVRNIGRWETSADFSYAQDVQTLLAVYTTSNYTYGTSVRRKLNLNTYWNVSYREARSGLTQQAGSSNHSQSVFSNFGWRRYSWGGSYSKGVGTTLLTSSGVLSPTPLASVISPEDLLLFNATSWGMSIGATPIRRLTLTASYSSFESDTLARSRLSMNRGERYNARLDYKLRKLIFRAGFSRTWQGISASGAPPVVLNSYYFGISRWFEVF